MKTGLSPAAAMVAAALAALLAGCVAPAATPQARLQRTQAIIASWSDSSRLLAARLIQEYGPPDEIGRGWLSWNDKGPWKRTTVWQQSEEYPTDQDGDNLEQVLAYPIAQEQRLALLAFSDKVRASDDGQELAVHADREELDFLALNLAHEILQGRRDPLDAFHFEQRTLRLSAAGKSSPYMQRLLFTPPQTAP
jgi:hypothetical protein